MKDTLRQFFDELPYWAVLPLLASGSVVIITFMIMLTMEFKP